MDDARPEARLHASEISGWDLRVVLAGHFRRIRHLDDQTVAYLRGREIALVTKYDGDHVISVEVGPALTSDDVAVLQSAVELGVLTDVGRKVRRQIAFAAVPVQGSWRFRDRFQIVPAPEEAPRPPGPIGQNPFVLEVSFADSRHMLVASERGWSAIREVNLLLSAFVPRIEGPDAWGHIDFQWAIVIGRPATRSVWTQKTYLLEGFEHIAKRFTALGDRALELIDLRNLYGQRGLMGKETLELPAPVESLFDRYYALDPTRRERLLRWAYWINHSSLVAGLSMSASYMAVIQAVEALRPDEGSAPMCVTCGRSTGAGPTSQFISFMDRYAPPEDGETEKARRRLYRLRSSLTHGGKLMEQDIHPGFGQFTPAWDEQRRANDRAVTLARLAGANWLLSDGQ